MTHTPKRQMILTMFMLTTGFQLDGWRHPASRIEDIGGFSLIRDMAQAAEAAKLHAIFFGDSVTVETIRDNNIRNTGLYEPISAIGALIGATENIGLVASLSTSFFEPYNAARQFAGLDHLSGGRVGWNIVTSLFGGAENFGADEMPSSEERYRKATDFVEVATRLWDSWAEDTVIADRASGQWARTEGIQDINYSGDYFSVQGALTVMRPPQGHPVLFQAGQSPAGMRLGASAADVIYTAQSDKEQAAAFNAQMRDLREKSGKPRSSLKILPGVVPLVGATEQEAREFSEDLASYVDLDAGMKRLSGSLGFSVEHLDLNDVIPEELFDQHPSQNSRREIWRKQAVERQFTVRDMIIDFARSGGHRVLIGSASQVAEQMIDWFDDGVCDGFNLDIPSVPEGMDRALKLLVPELQERGYFQREYTGNTLRECMGLERPEGRTLTPSSTEAGE